MPLEEPVAVARALASSGFNADREAVTLLANAPDPSAAIEHAVDAASPGSTRLTAADARPAIDATAGDDARGSGPRRTDPPAAAEDADIAARTDTAEATDATTATDDGPEDAGPGGAATAARTTGSDPTSTDGPDSSTTAPPDPSVSDAIPAEKPVEMDAETENGEDVPVETEGSVAGGHDPSLRSVDVTGDITGRSTGTGRYQDFVSVFRDRYERLARHLKGRVNHRATDTLSSAGGGGEAGLVGMVAEINSTKSGHWMIDLEDTRGTFPCLVMKDKEIAEHVDELLLDEVIAVEGSVSGDGSILFVDDLHFPDVPRTYRPNTADRPVQAALISDVHVGSQEFLGDAWSRFADWLHTEEAAQVEYLCIAFDHVAGDQEVLDVLGLLGVEPVGEATPGVREELP